MTPLPRARDAGSLHVLHVIDGLGLGGAERMLVDIANQTAADGHRVSVCVTRHGLALARELDARIDLLVLGRRSRLSPGPMLQLVDFIRSRRVDVIHAHMRSSLAFMLLLRSLRLVRPPIVFHDHFGRIETDDAIPAWFRVGHRGIAQYVGVYEKLRDWAHRAGMPASRTHTIPNALDLDRLHRTRPTNLREELGVEASVPLVLLVAALRRAKGVEVLLDAVTRSRHRDRMRVLIAGGDSEPDYAAECRARCAELGLEETVRFLGPRSDVPGLLRSVDVGLLASHSESGPLVLIEYLAAGLPIVSTLVGDIGRRLCELGVPGFVAAGAPGALARELDAVLDLSPSERRLRGELGRGTLDGRWGLRATMPRWYDVYRDAIRGAR